MNGNQQIVVGEEKRAAWEATARRKAAKAGRDPGTFVAWLTPVRNSPGWRQASHTARSLLMDLVHTNENGKLSATAKVLEPLGWRSRDVVTRGLRELVDCGLLVETRKGARPNRDSWYAYTWQKLKHTEGLDIDPKKFQTGGYMTPKARPAGPDRARTNKATKARKEQAICKKQGYTLKPSHGATEGVPCTVGRSIDEVMRPSDGAMQALSPIPLTPWDGTYLESGHLRCPDGEGSADSAAEARTDGAAVLTDAPEVRAIDALASIAKEAATASLQPEPSVGRADSPPLSARLNPARLLALMHLHPTTTNERPTP